MTRQNNTTTVAGAEKGPFTTSGKSNWCWILNPDGTPSTALGLETPQTKPMANRKRKRGNDAKASPAKKTSFCAKGSMPSGPSSWNWLLNSDGSPSTGMTAKAGATSARPGNRKRKREKCQDLLTEAPAKLSYNFSSRKSLSVDIKHEHDDNGTTKTMCGSTGKWIEMFRRLFAYAVKHNGSTHVKIYQAPPEQKSLGHWVYDQHTAYKQGVLSKEKRQLLESIGVDFHKRPKYHWMTMYERLLKFKDKHKTVRVSSTHGDDPVLGQWCIKQKHNPLSPKQTRLLNEVGFHWYPLDSDWMAKYKILKAFKETHGHTRVTGKTNPKLAFWVQAQRKYCKDEDRVDLLNEIGFEWSPRKADWMKMYKRLVAYKKEYGTCHVTQRYAKDPTLGNWVLRQRSLCKEKELVDLLDDIGFVWDGKSTTRLFLRKRLESGNTHVDCHFRH